MPRRGSFDLLGMIGGRGGRGIGRAERSRAAIGSGLSSLRTDLEGRGFKTASSGRNRSFNRAFGGFSFTGPSGQQGTVNPFMPGLPFMASASPQAAGGQQRPSTVAAGPGGFAVRSSPSASLQRFGFDEAGIRGIADALIGQGGPAPPAPPTAPAQASNQTIPFAQGGINEVVRALLSRGAQPGRTTVLPN